MKSFKYLFLILCFAAFVFSMQGDLYAHHILGIPHYSYDEDYPQTPVLTYRVDMGPHEIKMTGYPGKPLPGEQCTLHVYIKNLKDDSLFDGPVEMTVMQDKMIGADPIVYGPVEARLEESIYKFYPLFKEESNYLVRISYHAEGVPMIIDLPIVAGEPGSPLALLGSIVVGVIIFLVVVRAVRIKLKRKAAADSHKLASGETGT